MATVQHVAESGRDNVGETETTKIQFFEVRIADEEQQRGRLPLCRPSDKFLGEVFLGEVEVCERGVEVRGTQEFSKQRRCRLDGAGRGDKAPARLGRGARTRRRHYWPCLLAVCQKHANRDK